MLSHGVSIFAASVRRARAINRAHVARDLALVGAHGTALPDDVQDWIVALVRGATSGFSHRVRKDMASLVDAVDGLAAFASFHPHVVAIGYDIEECAAFYLSSGDLLAAILEKNALFSPDGFVIMDPHVRSGCIVDYNGCEGGVSIEGVVLSYLGEAASGH